MKKNLRSADVRRALAAGDPLTAVEIGARLRMPSRDVNIALVYLVRTVQVRACGTVMSSSTGTVRMVKFYELTPYGEDML